MPYSSNSMGTLHLSLTPSKMQFKVSSHPCLGSLLHLLLNNLQSTCILRDMNMNMLDACSCCTS